MTITSAIIMAIIATTLLLGVYVFAELRLHRSGRDVHEWTRKLARMLDKHQ